MTTTVAFVTDPAQATFLLPDALVALKIYSPRMAGTFADQTTTDVNGRTYRQIIGDSGVDMVVQSDDDHTDTDWEAIKQLGWYLVDSYSAFMALAFYINSNQAGSGGIVGTFNGPDSIGSGPASSGVDPVTGPFGYTNAGQLYSNYVKPTIDRYGMSILRHVGLSNEPATLTQANFGNFAIYRTDSDACDRFVTNQSRLVVNGLEAQAVADGHPAGVMRALCSFNAVAVGGDPIRHVSDRFGAFTNMPQIVNRWINGYNDFGSGWRHGIVTVNGTIDNNGVDPQFVSANPNTLYVKRFDSHGYSQAGVATANTGSVQDTVNGLFYEGLTQSGVRTSGSATVTGLASTTTFLAGMVVQGTGIPSGATILSKTSSTITLSANAASSGTSPVLVYDGEALIAVSGSPVNYTKPKGGFTTAQKKIRRMLNLAGGTDVTMAHTEMWPWTSSAHDGHEALTDYAMFLAAVKMAATTKIACYVFAGGNMASSADPAHGGAPTDDPFSGPVDAHFSISAGKIRKTTRWQSIRHAAYFNRNGPKNLMPATVSGAPASPQDTLPNALDSCIQIVQTVSDDGLAMAASVLNLDCTSSQPVTLSFDKPVSTATIAAIQTAQGDAFDTDAAAVTLTMSGDRLSTTHTMPAGSFLTFNATLTGSGSTSPPVNSTVPTINGILQVGQSLIDTGGDSWTGTVTSKSRKWQQANDAIGTGAADISPAQIGTSTLLGAGQLGKYIREGVKATNANGDDVAGYIYSAWLGPVVGVPITGDNDNFTRADEDPLTQGGAWSGPIQPGQLQITLVSNRAAAKSAMTSQSYRINVFEADSSRMLTVAIVPTVTNTGFALYGRIQNPGGAGTAAAYLLAYNIGTGYRLFKMTGGGTFAQIGSTDTSHVHAANESIRLDLTGTLLEGYWGVQVGTDATGNPLMAWTKLTFGSSSPITDSAITGPGYSGFEMNDGTGRSSFYGDVPLTGRPPFRVLADTFNTDDISVWQNRTDTGTSVTVAGGQVALAIGATQFSIVERQTRLTYDLTGITCRAHLVAAGDQTNDGTWAWVQWNLSETEMFGAYVHRNTVRAYAYHDDTFDYLGDAVMWAPGWIQASEKDGMLRIEFQAQTPGQPILLSETPVPFAVTALQLRIGGQNLD